MFWRRRRDSQGSALRLLRKQPIMFGFAEWSSSLSTEFLDVYCFGESISLSPSCGAQNWWSLLLVATNFDRCANSHSLHHPQGAVVFVARAVTGDRFKLSFKAKQKGAVKKQPKKSEIH